MHRFRGQEELSGMFESFPSFSYKIFSDLSNTSVKSDVSSQSENIFLREALEKERYRRKVSAFLSYPHFIVLNNECQKYDQNILSYEISKMLPLPITFMKNTNFSTLKNN